MAHFSARMRPSGFSLVELLVVIAVIGILIGIAIPAITKAKVVAKRSACAGNLHGVGVAFQAYLITNGDRMPYAAVLPSTGDSQYPGIAQTLSDDLDNPKALLCPADKKPGGGRYYDTEGSSYQYNTHLGGQTVEQTFLSEHFGDMNVFIMYDYRPFHGEAGKAGSTNYLFADGHVGDLGSGD